MRVPLEQRAVAVLRESPDRALPIGALHERLRAGGATLHDRASLLDALRARADLFTTVAPVSPLGDDPAWASHERAEYDAALGAVGAVAEPRIALNEEVLAALDAPASPGSTRSGNAALLEPTEQALLALWAVAAGNDDLRAELGNALAELDRMRARLGDDGTNVGAS